MRSVLLIVTPHFDRYLRFSRMAREIYADYTDLVEPFGLDEVWCDVTGTQKLRERGMEALANEIRERVKFELGITVSVGASWNKIFAKLGSDYKKPDAVTVFTPENYRDKVWPLPASDLLGVGRATERKLASRRRRGGHQEHWQQHDHPARPLLRRGRGHRLLDALRERGRAHEGVRLPLPGRRTWGP